MATAERTMEQIAGDAIKMLGLTDYNPQDKDARYAIARHIVDESGDCKESITLWLQEQEDGEFEQTGLDIRIYELDGAYAYLCTGDRPDLCDHELVAKLGLVGALEHIAKAWEDADPDIIRFEDEEGEMQYVNNHYWGE